MDGLRDDQLELLGRHHDRAFDALLTASAAYSGRRPLRDTAEGEDLSGAPRDLQVSIAISAAAAAVEMRRLQQERVSRDGVVKFGAADVFPSEVLGLLKRRRLPFSAADVELVLDLGTSTMDPDEIWTRSHETLSYGVSAAAHFLRYDAPSAPVLGALERAGGALDALGITPTSDPGVLRRRIGELVAANAPGGILDLSVIDDRDGWGELARELVRTWSQRGDGAQPLLARLAAARGSHPTATWSHAMSSLLDDNGDAPSLLRQLLEPVLELDLVPTPVGVPWPPSWLLAPANETILRGAAWAIRWVDEPWVAPLLGRLALRCAAPSPDRAVTTALSAPVCNASVDSLVALRESSPEAHAELRGLLGEIRRRDVLKRIAAAVDEDPATTAARDETIKLQKARSVRGKAATRGAREQRAVNELVRADLAPRLWDAGFTARRGRTFWRHHKDRVEVAHLASIRGERSLQVGTWFTSPRRLLPPPIRNDRPHPDEPFCDLRASFPADDLARAWLRAEAWLLRWSDPGDVLAFLVSDDAGNETWGHGAPDSAARNFILGYIASEVGRDDLARLHLARAAAWYRGRLEANRHTYSPELLTANEVWIAGIEADAGLL